MSSRSDFEFPSSFADELYCCICTGLKVLTASSAERVRLVVTLTKAGGTLRYSTLSVFLSFCVVHHRSVGASVGIDVLILNQGICNADKKNISIQISQRFSTLSAGKKRTFSAEGGLSMSSSVSRRSNREVRRLDQFGRLACVVAG